MLNARFKKKLQGTALALLSSLLLTQCADDIEVAPQVPLEEDATLTAASTSCNCTYTVPSRDHTQVVDGAALGLKPGAVICLNAANQYVNITFRNLVGTAAAPIIIKNCGGTATVNGSGRPYTFKTENSRFFEIDGGTGTAYGIRIIGGHMGLTLEKMSTDFKVHNIEVYNSGFAGIMAKTDPSCSDPNTWRGKFVMRNVSFYNNYVHDTGGEGFYVGNSFYEFGMQTSCGRLLPHIVDGVRIYDNRIVKAGWEAIQIGCALTGAYVYNNVIENYGYKNEPVQNNGVQFSEGTKAIAYNNFIKDGKGTAFNIIGYGDSFIHDNVIVNAGSFGIFCDERTTRNLPGFRIINNTIINPKSDGVRMYNESVPGYVYNNIIVNPGSYPTYSYPRTGQDAYVYKIGKTIPVTVANNLFTRDINTVKFNSPSTYNYRLTSTSPALNKGKDIASYNIPRDFYHGSRLYGAGYDIGAEEFEGTVTATTTDKPAATNVLPVANSGKDITIDLPVSTATIRGSGTDSDGTIVSYRWTQVKGPTTRTLSGTSTATLYVSKVVAGNYVFRLTVTDDRGGTDYDDMLLKVIP